MAWEAGKGQVGGAGLHARSSTHPLIILILFSARVLRDCRIWRAFLIPYFFFFLSLFRMDGWLNDHLQFHLGFRVDFVRLLTLMWGFRRFALLACAIVLYSSTSTVRGFCSTLNSRFFLLLFPTHPCSLLAQWLKAAIKDWGAFGLLIVWAGLRYEALSR